MPFKKNFNRFFQISVFLMQTLIVLILVEALNKFIFFNFGNRYKDKARAIWAKVEIVSG